MKTKRTIGIAVLSTIAAILLFSPTTFAASSSTPLNLSVQGMITNAGTQVYSFGGGSVVAGEILGTPLGSSVNYQVNAYVHGLNTNGEGFINTGSTSVQITINGQVGEAFPLGPPPDYAPCTSGCNSEIPIFFTGVATVRGGGSSTAIPVLIESPYLNPFGNPIVISSTDGVSIQMVVTYTRATITWMGVSVQGLVSGTYGSEQVVGAYSSTTFSQENLVSGVEHDTGSVSFTGMSDAVTGAPISALNANGLLFGSTTIPPIGTGGSFSCASDNPNPVFYIPTLPAGTCTATGATSSGTFSMLGHGGTIKGTYATDWSVPSLFTSTTVTATVSQH